MRVVYSMTAKQKTAAIVSASTAIVAVAIYFAICQIAGTKIKEIEADMFADFIKDIPPEQRAIF